MPCSSAKRGTVIFVNRMKQYLKNPHHTTQRKPNPPVTVTGTDDVSYTVLKLEFETFVRRSNYSVI